MLTPKGTLFAAILALGGTPAMAEGPSLGKPLSEAEVPSYARYVMPEGDGLPAGSGNAKKGAEIYASKCGSCHGATGEEGPIQPPVGPNKAYAKAAGQHWPYATTLFAYIQRAMPFNAPKSLSNDEVYSVVAYILSRNKIIDEGQKIDQTNLAGIKMPGKDKFIDLWAQQKEKPY